MVRGFFEIEILYHGNGIHDICNSCYRLFRMQEGGALRRDVWRASRGPGHILDSSFRRMILFYASRGADGEFQFPHSKALGATCEMSMSRQIAEFTVS